MRSVAVIPARGGSKRIAGKNIREFCGKPMIAWSIEAAVQAGIFDEVRVSTDCPAIATVAREHGAVVADDLRPLALSDDTTPLLDVMQYEAQQYQRSPSTIPEAMCFILATAPFVEVTALREGIALMSSDRWDYALAATTFPAPVERAFTVDKSGATRMVFDDAYSLFSNNLPETYHDAGQFYWGRFAAWLAPTVGFFGPRTTVIERPRYRCQDIDTETDWITAEVLFKTLRSEHRLDQTS